MKYLPALFLAALLSSGCVSATVEVEDVCSSKELSFPGVPVAVSVLAGERTVTVTSNSDMSDTIGKVSDIATVSLTSVSLNMNSTSNLTFLHHVKVTIYTTADPSNELLLSDANFTGLDLPISADQNKLLALLSKGPATMKFIVTGNIPTAPTDATASFCIGMSAHVSKSIGDIK